MSDDIVDRLSDYADQLQDAQYKQMREHITHQAAEITRLRAAIATAQVEAFKKAAEIAREFAQSEGWSGTSALRMRNYIIAESAIYTKTGRKE